MKKIIVTVCTACLFHVLCYSQAGFSKMTSAKKNNSLSLLSLLQNTNEEAKGFKSFLSNLPALNLFSIKRVKPAAICAELSFSDILEGTFESINPNLVNTYDDDFPELFETPSFKIKIKYIISL